jgi:pimeloyl-ACP methyl ester carboxylesterase
MSGLAPAPPAPPLPPLPLPGGIRSRTVPVRDLAMHVLEAGHETPSRPALLLLHGFPELAYSWRKVMPALAQAGFHVIAPDQRGYGRTTGWDASYDGSLEPFGLLNLVEDAVALSAAMGHPTVDAVIGHDFGSPVAAWCALTRPDVFRSVAMMSAPFGGVPAAPTSSAPSGAPSVAPDIHQALASLPRPRKHYQWYYGTREADRDMREAPQGLHAFLRAYYHVKSADWPGNRPYRLPAWDAASLAQLPTYYVMDRDADMAATVAPHMPDAAAIAACGWLPDDELAVYAAEFGRTGFQGGLQWYRCATGEAQRATLSRYAGRRIDVAACFIAGASDWGIHQKPGDLDRMQQEACTRMIGCHLIDGAGHWVQQERPAETVALLLDFLAHCRD